MTTIPIIELSSSDAPSAIAGACAEHGFFLLAGHGIPPAFETRLRAAAATFFALAEDEKQTIAMARGGRAWRGYFPVGGELTSGTPDRKEGLYIGSELPADHPRVQAGVPLHGANLWPAAVPELRDAVVDWMTAVEQVGHAVLAAMARGLGAGDDFFARCSMHDPTVLFRIFHYPPAPPDDDGWGVGEHTDYGLLTLLLQDDVGGLEVKSRGAWLPVPAVPGTLVCNLGDMLDRMTAGRFHSTPHRVRNLSGRDRYSFPLFLDPAWDARVSDDGTWGEYLLAKVSRVFPALFADVID